ncbi:MAG TPA: glycosyltransferase family 39 protein [Tepidisphaeraceae bacterium]|nr:glycosyltransferase family 39 protein [Tepidisphaeraceae bacterium]
MEQQLTGKLPLADARDDQEDGGAASAGSLKAFLTAALLALGFFLATAPTLSMQGFAGGSEALNVETVLEMRRGGPWLIPTLRGAPRTIKPPLTAWTTAAFVPPSTVAALSTPDPAAREAAYRRLAWKVRWPTLALSCITIALIFEMGRLLGGYRIGLTAGLVAGSTIMFMRFGRVATTDVQLSLWVAAADVLLLHAILRGRWWTGCVGGGIALGLAVMSKGPVALVQSIMPVLAALAWLMWRRDRTERPIRPEYQAKRSTIAIAVTCGTLLMVFIAAAWFLWVWWITPGIVEAWVREVTREGATNLEPDPWHNYLSSLPWMFPWLIFFVVGLIMTTQAAWRGDRRQTLALSLLIVPIVVMSLFQDKPTRYLQPMLAPAAVVTAIALAGQWRAWRDQPHIDRVLSRIHYAAIAIAIVALAAGGAFGLLETTAGQPWYRPKIALPIAMVGLEVLALVMWQARRRPWVMVGGTVAIMLAMQPMFLKGYVNSVNGRSLATEVADHILSTEPDAEAVVFSPGFRRSPPIEMFIYMNRVLPVVGTLADVPASDRDVYAINVASSSDTDVIIPPPWHLDREWRWGDGRPWRTYVRPATEPATLPAAP